MHRTNSLVFTIKPQLRSLIWKRSSNRPQNTKNKPKECLERKIRVLFWSRQPSFKYKLKTNYIVAIEPNRRDSRIPLFTTRLQLYFPQKMRCSTIDNAFYIHQIMGVVSLKKAETYKMKSIRIQKEEALVNVTEEETNLPTEITLEPKIKNRN